MSDTFLFSHPPIVFPVLETWRKIYRQSAFHIRICFYSLVSTTLFCVVCCLIRPLFVQAFPTNSIQLLQSITSAQIRLHVIIWTEKKKYELKPLFLFDVLLIVSYNLFVVILHIVRLKMWMEQQTRIFMGNSWRDMIKMETISMGGGLYCFRQQNDTHLL